VVAAPGSPSSAAMRFCCLGGNTRSRRVPVSRSTDGGGESGAMPTIAENGRGGAELPETAGWAAGSKTTIFGLADSNRGWW
jgi:hypothetical protein